MFCFGATFPVQTDGSAGAKPRPRPSFAPAKTANGPSPEDEMAHESIPLGVPDMVGLPDTIDDVAALEDVLASPSPDLVADVDELQGDVAILGVGGKMGPTLARLLKAALDAAGKTNRVVGVDRFTDSAARKPFEDAGIETVACNLLDPKEMAALDVSPNVIYMVGMKFGATGQEPLTWAINSYLPGMVVQHFAGSRIAALSSGNIYHLTPVALGGSIETDVPSPVGEYAQSTLGRERIFEHWSGTTGTPVTLVRLNYSVELRYGVLLDIATNVAAGQPVDVAMGNLNCIWQGDANAAVIRSLALADTPPCVINVTGPEILSVRRLAEGFGELSGTEPVCVGEEAPTALLSNAAAYYRRFGYPRVSIARVMEWIAHWVKIDGPTLNKPTHFQTRDGKF